MTEQENSWKLAEAQLVYRAKVEVALGELMAVQAECARYDAEQAMRAEMSQAKLFTDPTEPQTIGGA